MKIRLLRGIVALSAVSLLSGAVSAQILGTTAKQLSRGTLETSLFYQGTGGQHLNFEVTNGGGSCASNNAISLPAPTFNCGSTADVAGRGDGQAVVAKVSYQAAERGLIVYASAGTGDYALRVGSANVFNSSLEDRAGFLASFGTKAVAVPGTEVSPAFAVDASVGIQRYWGAGLRLDLLHIQVALESSHVFKFEEAQVEPYGGLKWVRTQAYLKDISTGSRVGGRKKMMRPFLGIRVPLFERDGVFAEVAFVHGVQYATGLTMRFGKNI